MPTRLPTDANNNPISALRLCTDGAHAVAVSGNSARNTVAFNAETRVISLYATTDVYIKFSGNASDGATSASHFFPAGIYYDFAIGDPRNGNYRYIHALRVSADGMIYVSEKE